MALRPSSDELGSGRTPGRIAKNSEGVRQIPLFGRLVPGDRGWRARRKTEASCQGKANDTAWRGHAFSWCDAMGRGRVAQCVGSSDETKDLEKSFSCSDAARVWRASEAKALGRLADGATRNRGRRRQALWRRATSRG